MADSGADVFVGTTVAAGAAFGASAFPRTTANAAFVDTKTDRAGRQRNGRFQIVERNFVCARGEAGRHFEPCRQQSIGLEAVTIDGGDADESAKRHRRRHDES